MPKLMGHIADSSDMSTGFIVPLACFVFVAFYGLVWSKLSQSEGGVAIKLNSGH